MLGAAEAMVLPGSHSHWAVMGWDRRGIDKCTHAYPHLQQYFLKWHSNMSFVGMAMYHYSNIMVMDWLRIWLPYRFGSVLGILLYVCPYVASCWCVWRVYPVHTCSVLWSTTSSRMRKYPQRCLWTLIEGWSSEPDYIWPPHILHNPHGCCTSLNVITKQQLPGNNEYKQERL